VGVEPQKYGNNFYFILPQRQDQAAVTDDREATGRIIW